MTQNRFALAYHLHGSSHLIRLQWEQVYARGAVWGHARRQPVYGHPISENAIEKTGIEHYYYIAKFKYGDAINTTCNLLCLTGPPTLHILPAASTSWQQEVEQDVTKLNRTCRSPPHIPTLDQASDWSKSICKEQLGGHEKWGHSMLRT